MFPIYTRIVTLLLQFYEEKRSSANTFQILNYRFSLWILFDMESCPDTITISKLLFFLLGSGMNEIKTKATLFLSNFFCEKLVVSRDDRALVWLLQS